MALGRRILRSQIDMEQFDKKVVVLVGGVGGAKLAHGLAQILPPSQLTVIVNTGDDFWHYGLRVCPDLDTVMYTLAGLVDKRNGWGVAEDTRAMLGALRRYGEEPWFGLGDQDIATHLLRTLALQSGERLTTITERLTKSLGILHRILPMTDEPVATMIDTVEQGELEFQEYFVRYRWQPTVRAIRYAGAEDAHITSEVEAALWSADVILLGPSNPWLSVAPIFAVPGLRDVLVERADVPRVALTPIVAGQALKGPAAKIMAELGLEVSARTVAAFYGDAINGFVFDERDADLRFADDEKSSILHTFSCDTIMNDDDSRAVLARRMLEWLLTWDTLPDQVMP